MTLHVWLPSDATMTVALTATAPVAVAESLLLSLSSFLEKKLFFFCAKSGSKCYKRSLNLLTFLDIIETGLPGGGCVAAIALYGDKWKFIVGLGYVGMGIGVGGGIDIGIGMFPAGSSIGPWDCM